MYCPRCGRQASEDVSFCSGCGLPLVDAAALVESGGRLDAAAGRRAGLTPRQRGVRKGLMITAGGLLFAFLAFVLMELKQDLFVFLPIAAVVLTFGVMRLFYGLLLEDDSARLKDSKRRAAPEEAPPALAGARASALPHARQRPASDFAAKKTADTADMSAPASVVDATTKLLKDDA